MIEHTTTEIKRDLEDPIYPVIQSACGNIYMNVRDYETQNYMHVDFDYERQEMAESQFQLQVSQQTRSGWHLPQCQKYFVCCSLLCSDQLKLVPYIQECLIC